MQAFKNKKNMTVQRLLDEGLHCYHERRLEEALFYFEKLLDVADNNVDLLHTIVKLLQEMQDFSKAAMYGEKLLVLSPENEDFLLSQAENHFFLKDYQSALQLYLKLHQQFPSSLHLLNRFILICNEDVKCLSSLQLQLLADNDLEHETLVDSALSLSEALLNKDELDKGKIILESLLAIEQENLEVFGLYGIFLEKSSNREKAIFYLDKAVDNGHFKYLSTLAKCLEMVFNIPAVVFYLEKLVEKFPDHDVTKKLLGYYYYRNDDYGNADKIFSNFSVSPEDDIYLFKYKTLARFKVVDERSGAQDINVHISLMNDLFSLWKHLPQDEQVSSNLVLFYLNLGEIEKAHDICLKLDEVIPGNLTNKWNKHVYYRAKGLKDEYFDAYLAGRHIRYRKSWSVIKDKVWNGESLKGKRIVVFREQGVGDELLFASNYGWLVDKAEHIDVFCASRLKDIFSCAFPTINFIPISEESFNCNDESVFQLISDADKIILSGDLPSFIYRERRESLYEQVFLEVEGYKKTFWNSKLANLTGRNKPKVGLIWRSGFVSSSRSKHFLDVYEVASIISGMPDADFFSCMYVECDNEIKEIEKLSGRKIHVIPELDQKNDFGNTAAMLSSLNVLVGAYTATLSLAAAVGTPIVAYASDYFKNDGVLKKRALYYKDVVHISLPNNDNLTRREAVKVIMNEVRLSIS
ncbi:hypothetical protein Q9290_00085 [Oceanimonas sp. CHS3-5]|uniref:tetratricopeptide repeat protein n=1 Tax=Oceanimonas sp. CHS3-5 TaxID=3068186 RepID=UPI00273E462A|nr:hypothetical protein [Oceanimonas sp. CHS3-5]MDP5290700.1 hypothetical protein [Oceanimonas sp. CHS3-5]